MGLSAIHPYLKSKIFSRCPNAQSGATFSKRWTLTELLIMLSYTHFWSAEQATRKKRLGYARKHGVGEPERRGKQFDRRTHELLSRTGRQRLTRPYPCEWA